MPMASPTGIRRQGSSIRAELDALDHRPRASQAEKKNYAEAFSRSLAIRIANALRPSFDGITPDAEGRQQEAPARTAKGYKKLDVNYSKPEIGLGLGISIKTFLFKNKDNRYKKNFTARDNELRAETHDYHERQPFSVMIGLIFMPFDSCDDATRRAPSSFGSAVKMFRLRAGRTSPADSPFLFEKIFIGLIETKGPQRGEIRFFDVSSPPPWSGRPSNLLSFDELVAQIKFVYDERNVPPFEWDEGAE